MRNKLYRKNGQLTSYALACGYVYYKNNYSLQFIHNTYKVNSLYEEHYFDTLNAAYKFLTTKNK